MITEQRLGGRIGGWTCDSRDINLPVQARPAIRAGCVASRLKGRKLRRLLVAAVACLSFAGPSFAEPGQTIAAATMRKMPSVSSRVVQHIPADAQIDVSHCGGGWCYGSWRNLFGYIPADAVVTGPPGVGATFAVAPPIAPAPPTVAVAPAWGWAGPYVGFGWGWQRW